MTVSLASTFYLLLYRAPPPPPPRYFPIDLLLLLKYSAREFYTVLIAHRAHAKYNLINIFRSTIVIRRVKIIHYIMVVRVYVCVNEVH